MGRGKRQWKRNVKTRIDALTQQLSHTQTELAAELLARGQLVAFPTETVYGLGADAWSDHAVARIFEAKGRPNFNPLIVHLPDLDSARQIAEFDDTADRLATAFWPGPLSLVLPLRLDAGISALVTAGLPTVALRVPASDMARDILRRANGPIAAPSANPSGMISPTTAAHVMAGLSGRIDAVIDGGPCAVGLESTIVSTNPPRLLRPGGLPQSAIEACLQDSITQHAEGDAISAPGQLLSHYAPQSRIRLEASNGQDGEIMIGFGPSDAPYNLSPAGDLVEAAANLFAMLHAADDAAQAQGKTLAIAPVPEQGLGVAINDRLRRAAAD